MLGRQQKAFFDWCQCLGTKPEQGLSSKILISYAGYMCFQKLMVNPPTALNYPSYALRVRLKLEKRDELHLI